ncbi:MAG TPA: Rab family GTPase [Candidatus Deferrimicrobium sp.]|nr:Rab family GTPase [Candidatus Deferrimicrobium sp.]
MSIPNSKPSGELEFKILVVGEDSVGKTSLIIRFIGNRFDDITTPKTLEGESITTKLDLFSVPVKLQVQDILQEIWENVVSYYVSDNDGILLVLDITSKAKMKSYLDYWLRTIREVKTEIPVIVLGNKSDLQPKVNIDKTSQYCAKLGSFFIKTSAKTGENVSYAFKLLTSEIVKKKAAAKKQAEAKRTDGLDNVFTKYDL